MNLHDGVFQRFTDQRRKDLQRISRATRGEHPFEDVVQEAWLMTLTLQTDEGSAVDLSEAACQERLLSYLYQHLVRYTELNVRNAVRLDHAPKGGGDEGDAHPLTYLLVSDGGRDPLGELIEHEADAALESGLHAHGSLAAAYVYLLRQCDNRMSAVADHLRISLSYAYRRCAHARWLAVHVRHIPIPAVEVFTPMPWRRFRLRRPHTQLAFDFDDQLPI